MIKKAKNILSLKSNEVLDFFMKSEQYHGFELPEYFDFDKVLLYVRESIGEKLYDECLTDIRPDDLPNVNLDILLNKKYQGEFKRDTDLHDVTICAKTSSTCEAYALGMPDIKVLSLDSERKLFEAAKEGKCDGVITNEPILQYFLKVSADRDKFYRLGKKLTFAQFGIMTSKNRPDVSERISKALEKVKTTPYFQEIYHKWFE